MTQWLKTHGVFAIVGIILALVLATIFPNVLRMLVTLPLVLFLPGFALTIILFKRGHLGVPEQLLLSVGLSVAITALSGLILNWTPWGLRTTTLWIALLVVLAVEMVVVGYLYGLHWTKAISLPSQVNFTPRQWILVSLAALVTLTAVYVDRAPVPQEGFEGYTTLWIQPSDSSDTFELGVRSNEFETTKYQIRVELDGNLSDGPTLELKPGETWEGVLSISSGELKDQPLKIFLYRLDQPNEVYRHAVWWPE